MQQVLAADALQLCLLPDSILCHILRHLPDTVSIAHAICSCSAIRQAARQDDDGIWTAAAATEAWRLRLRSGDTLRDLCIDAKRALQTQRLTLLGGCNKAGVALAVVESYDVRNQEWHTERELAMPREAPAVACDGSDVTFLGGWDGESTRAMCTVESARFRTANGLLGEDRRISDGPWRRRADLPQELCFGAAEIDAERRLFFAGGGSSIFRGASCSAEVVTLYI